MPLRVIKIRPHRCSPPHCPHCPPPQASTLKPALGVIIDELANLKNSTGHGREAYDNLGKELDLLQVTSA